MVTELVAQPPITTVPVEEIVAVEIAVLEVREGTATSRSLLSYPTIPDATRRGTSGEEEVVVCVNNAAGVCLGQSLSTLLPLLVGCVVCVCVREREREFVRERERVCERERERERERESLWE